MTFSSLGVEGIALVATFFGLSAFGTEQLARKTQINDNKPINLILLLIDLKDVRYLKFI